MTFFVTGSDDPRDRPQPGGGIDEPKMRFRIDYQAGDRVFDVMPYSSPAAMLEDLSTLGGGRFHGARVEFETCAFDYVFDAATEDALGRLDGTPLRTPFVAGSPPAIDSLLVPPVILLAPTCPPDRSQFCVDVDPASFGPDTLVVLGVHVPDDPSDGLQTPLGLGWNTFTLPLRAWAHDHPRDRNVPGQPPYYTEGTEGRVLAWKYSFDCTEPGCPDLALPGEDFWIADRRPRGEPVTRQVFDEPLVITIALDTLCTSIPCTPGAIRAVLDFARFGRYEFNLQARDTAPVGHSCWVPIALSPLSSEFEIDISDLGRVSREHRASAVLQAWRAARPAAFRGP